MRQHLGHSCSQVGVDLKIAVLHIDFEIAVHEAVSSVSTKNVRKRSTLLCASVNSKNVRKCVSTAGLTSAYAIMPKAANFGTSISNTISCDKVCQWPATRSVPPI